MSSRLTATLARTNERATLFLARIAAVALAVIALTTFCDVIGRYFFKAPFSFTVELTEMGMAVLVYFGIGLVTHENGHISADFLVARLPPKPRALLALVTNFLALGFVGLTIWQLWLHAVYLFAEGRSDTELARAVVARRLCRCFRQPVSADRRAAAADRGMDDPQRRTSAGSRGRIRRPAIPNSGAARRWNRQRCSRC